MHRLTCVKQCSGLFKSSQVKRWMGAGRWSSNARFRGASLKQADKATQKRSDGDETKMEALLTQNRDVGPPIPPSAGAASQSPIVD